MTTERKKEEEQSKPLETAEEQGPAAPPDPDQPDPDIASPFTDGGKPGVTWTREAAKALLPELFDRKKREPKRR